MKYGENHLKPLDFWSRMTAGIAFQFYDTANSFNYWGLRQLSDIVWIHPVRGRL